MTQQHASHDTPCPESPSVFLTAGIAAAAELAKDRPDYRSVISWLSAECAALERVAFPAARRALHDNVTVKRQLELTRDLEHSLLGLYQTINGDGRAVDRHLDVVVAGVRRLLDEQLALAGRLLHDLHEAIPAWQWDALLVRHRGALADAPTRPHPYAPHGGLAERIAFAMDGALDRLMETLDSQAIAAIPEQPCA